jgi:plastocyanin
MTTMTGARTPWGLAVVLCLAASCSKSPTTPTPSPTPVAATITITAAGVSPKSVQVALGSRIRFVNNDTREHDMGSDPHPDHTDCPPINQVGILKPGEQRDTGNLVVARTCGYHDHEDPDNTALQGSIIIR